MEELFSSLLKVSWHKDVWHKCFNIKYSLYSWLALNGGFKTVDLLVVRGIFINISFNLCGVIWESTSFLFFFLMWLLYLDFEGVIALENQNFAQSFLLQILDHIVDIDNIDTSLKSFTIFIFIAYFTSFGWKKIISSLIEVLVEYWLFSYKSKKWYVPNLKSGSMTISGMPLNRIICNNFFILIYVSINLVWFLFFALGGSYLNSFMSQENFGYFWGYND